ncbi:MAG: ATP-binding protein [Chloroflexota bacterium]
MLDASDSSLPLILCISADSALKAELSGLLAGTGFELAFASDTGDGLARAEALLPAVILLDFGPNLAATEVCRRLRANRLLAGIPIVMIVSREERDARAAGLGAGADDFLDKPFDGLELLARLRTLTRLSTHRLMLSDLKRFSWMVQHADEGYLLLDRAGGIQYANDFAGQLLNLPEDSLGLPFVKVVERLYVPEPEEVWRDWPTDPEPLFLVQPESPTARASWVVVEALDMPVHTDYHRIVRLREVTERMSIYQDMRRFHTVVSHKLRTPMAIMYTNLNVIKNRLDMLSPDQVKDFARSAIEGADRLANEIRSILSYIDAPLSLTLGDPLRLDALPDMVVSVSRLLGLGQVSLSLPRDLEPATVALTHDAVEMIFFELLENARKFHPAHAPRVEISVDRADAGHVLVRVMDDGVNLSVEQQKWAWLPYVQGEKDFSGELPGIGLGFPMVATLVWKSGGDLRLRNRPDAPGVLVEMKLPLEETARRRERIAAPFGE